MTQFASTLCAQANPSNPLLLWAREVGTEDVLDEVRFSSGSYLVGTSWGTVQVSAAHVVHARIILERLANRAG